MYDWNVPLRGKKGLGWRKDARPLRLGSGPPPRRGRGWVGTCIGGSANHVMPLAESMTWLAVVSYAPPIPIGRHRRFPPGIVWPQDGATTHPIKIPTHIKPTLALRIPPRRQQRQRHTADHH